MSALPVPEAQLRALFQAAVDAASPAHVLPRYLAGIPDPRPHGRLIVIGAGKAAAAMAAAVRGHFGPCEGALITRHGHAVPFARTAPDVIEAGHPVPDDAGFAATQRILDMATGL